jgi:hypothetical protein
MAVTLIGTLPTTLNGSPSDSVEQSEGYEFRVSFDSSVTATVTYKISSEGFSIDDLPKLNSPHPHDQTLTLFESSASRESGKIMKVVLTYKGVVDSNLSENYAQSEFNTGTTSEPIETHPKFAYPFNNPGVIPQELCAIKKALENNIDYGKNNKFINETGESVPATQPGRLLYILKKFGIESYLNLTGTYRRSYVKTAIPTDYSNVGYITQVAPLGTPPITPPVIGYRNYLQTSLTWKKQASIVSISEEYMLSGASGWNEHIYTKPQDPAQPQKLTQTDKTRVPL